MISAPGIQYQYDSRNRRIWSGTVDSNNNITGQTLAFFGIAGTRLGTYTLSVTYGIGLVTEIADPPANLAMYFGGKRVDIAEDQVGSNLTIRMYPWGEDKVAGSNDQTKFATYTRDSATLLDYANNRYYNNAGGRFMTPDPYAASGGPADPQSWNRYAYTRGDPVNRFDGSGLSDCNPNEDEDVCWDEDDTAKYNGFSYSLKLNVSSPADDVGFGVAMADLTP